MQLQCQEVAINTSTLICTNRELEETNDNENANSMHSEKNSDNDSSRNYVMIKNNVDFQRANCMPVLLEYWCDSDTEEGMIRPLSSLVKKEKMSMSRMGDRFCRCKAIAEKYKRCGSRK